MNQTLQDIAQRRSIRAFTGAQVAGEALDAVLAAGRAAPSSMNRQPWHFTVIQNRDLLSRMVEKNREAVLASPELAAANQWIRTPGYDNFYRAPTVILVSGDLSNPWHVFDCALATENMALAAHALSLGTCIVASARYLFAAEKARAFIGELGIPEGFAPVCALALGQTEGTAPPPPPRREDCVNYVR